jgi:hypothetical protein
MMMMRMIDDDDDNYLLIQPSKHSIPYCRHDAAGDIERF